jgi:ribose transport system permease protein
MTTTAVARPVIPAGIGTSAIRFVARYGTLIALAVMIVYFSIEKPDAFATKATAINILEQSATLVVLTVGLTVAMVQNEFDLSIAAMSTMAGLLVAGFQSFDSASWPLAVILVLLIACSIGLISGLLVSILGLDSFIATLAVSTIIDGVCYWYNKGQAIGINISPQFVSIGRGKSLGLPNLVWIAAVVALVIWVLLTYTPIGRTMYAIGGNREAARLAGVAVTRTRILAFVISGGLAALAGIMLTAQSGQGSPGAGTALLLQAFTAAFLGSVTLRDGEFHVVGTVIGVLLLSVIFTGLTIMGVAVYVQNWATGGMLIVAISLSAVTRRLRRT